MHDGGGRTRAQLTRDLGLARGTASVLIGELTASHLLTERPAPRHGRGRPTLVPGAHPRGPMALAVDLREDAWEIAAGELGGLTTTLEVRAHDGTPEGALPPLGRALRALHTPRVVGVGMAVAGPVRQRAGAEPTLDVASLGWREVRVGELLALGRLPLLLGNDARLAALAEARRGLMRGVAVGLHLHVAFDLGGSLLLAGRPLTGATGTAGEFGHLPLAGDGPPCRCGATGCWGVQVGADALLRRLGLPYGGGRGREAAERVLTGARSGERAAVEAVRAVAATLGAGVGALVNAHDPDLVTLSGFGGELLRRRPGGELRGSRQDGESPGSGVTLRDPEPSRELLSSRQDGEFPGDAMEAAYRAALMAMRRQEPPPIVAAELGWRGPLIGAMEAVFDAFLTAEAVETWRHARTHGVIYPTSQSAST